VLSLAPETVDPLLGQAMLQVMEAHVILRTPPKHLQTVYAGVFTSATVKLGTMVLTGGMAARWPALAGTATMGETTVQADRQKGGDQMTVQEQEAVPPALELIQALVNTVDLEDGEEDLSSPDALREWLVGRGLLDAAAPVSQSDLAMTIELREALRAMLRANDGDPVDHEAVRIVNRMSEGLPLQLRFSRQGEPALDAQGVGVAHALATLLAGVAVAQAQGTWSRLKVCASDTCQWAFYDRSKNRSGRWCSMRVCGNRTKTRTYRARRRSQGDDQ
jgi:predicted RNA-binding Zn ribbon-like protein